MARIQKKSSKDNPAQTISAAKKNKPVARSSWRSLVIFIAAFLVYSGTIGYDYACDDNMYTYENTFVQKGISSLPDLVGKGSLYGFNGTNVADYRPVVLISFALEKTIFGNSPATGHLINVLLYAFLCLVIFRFTRRILGDRLMNIAFMATLIFALHPLHSEVVANIKSRDELLCALFGLLSLNFLLRFDTEKKIRLLVNSLVTFFLCMLCKENGFTFLMIAPLILYFFTTAPLKRIAKSFVPYFAIAIFVFLIRRLVLEANLFDHPFEAWQNSLAAASGLSLRLATCFSILLHAFTLLVYPVTLSWDYSFNHFPIVSWTDWHAILSLAIHTGLLIVAIAGLRRKSIYSFLILFYFITYSITSNTFYLVGNTFAERFLFIPSLAFCIALPLLIFKLFRIKTDMGISGARNAYAMIGIILVLYSIRTIARNADWKDNKTLHESGVRTAPNSAWVHYIYAMDHGKIVKETQVSEQKMRSAEIAITEFNRCIEINPEFEIAFLELGEVYSAVGQNAKAEEMFKKAIALKPDFSEALYDYGRILFLRNDFTRALKQFELSGESNPKNTKAFLGAGACSRSLGDNRKAIYYFEKVLESAPTNTDLMRNLSTLYLEVGDTTKAIEYSNRAAGR